MGFRSCLAATACQCGSVIGFKGGQAGVEQFASRDDDNVEAGGNFVATENFSHQSFGTISLDSPAQLFCRCDPQATPRAVIGQDEERAVAPSNPGAALVDLLKLGAPADPFVPSQARALDVQ